MGTNANGTVHKEAYGECSTHLVEAVTQPTAQHGVWMRLVHMTLVLPLLDGFMSG